MNEPNRLGRTRLRQLVTDRDIDILRSIREHRFLTSRHIYELHFGGRHASEVSGVRACNRILNRLQEHRFVYRLERPVGGLGGGSAPAIWGIDHAGDRLLRRGGGGEETGRSRAFQPTLFFLAHTLAVADLRVSLEKAARDGKFDLLSVTMEPDNWRPFTTRSGKAEILKPDLHAVIGTGEWETHLFAEVDRGTEITSRLISKSTLYQQYHDTGIEQAANGVFPRVVWLIDNPARRERLRALIRADQTLTDQLFLITTNDDLMGSLAQSFADISIQTSTAEPVVEQSPTRGTQLNTAGPQ
jgi:hypothetical protein